MSSAPKPGVKGFTPGPTMDTQVSNPSVTSGKAGGSMDTPPSGKSNIVQPAKSGPKVQDSGITNKGT